MSIPTVPAVEDYLYTNPTIESRELPLVHRAILIEIARLTDLFADAVDARDHITAATAADEAARLRQVLDRSFRLGAQ